jgi:hypothetical protein
MDVSDDASWLAAFGVEPQTEETPGEVVRVLRIPTGETEELVVSWDEAACSVRMRHLRRGTTLVDLLREMATALRVETTRGDSVLVMEYRAADASGRVLIQVWPEVTFADTFMYT